MVIISSLLMGNIYLILRDGIPFIVYISKAEREGRVETSLKLLSPEERVEEIARILGGINITEVQRAAAREMIEGAEV